MTLLDWSVLGAYFLGMLAVGWYYSRRVATADDYLLGGRNMQSWTVGLSLFATLFSTISYLAYPGEMVKHGPMFFCGMLAYPVIAVVVGWCLIPCFMGLKATSAYEILESKLGLGVRILGSTLFLLLRLLWMAVIVNATSTHVLVPLAGLDHSAVPATCLIMTLITIIYTAMGGLRAVVITDVVQAGILFGGAAVAMAVITHDLGGVSAWWPTQWDPQWQPPQFGFDPTARVSLVAVVLAEFTWHICTSGSDQMTVQRYLATRDARSARRMYNISLAANVVVQIFLAALGLALLAYFRAHRDLLPDSQLLALHPDQMLPQFIAVGLGPGFRGLVVAGLLAAAMSSLASGLSSSCSVITTDFIDRFCGICDNDRARVRRARLISLAVGATVVLLSFGVGVVQGNLLEIAYKVVNLLVAPLFGLFVMALFVPWSTSSGTFVGATVGLLVAGAINYWVELTGTKGISFLWAMPLSLVAQVAVGSMASLMFPDRGGQRRTSG